MKRCGLFFYILLVHHKTLHSEWTLVLTLCDCFHRVNAVNMSVFIHTGDVSCHLFDNPQKTVPNETNPLNALAECGIKK